MVQAGACCVHGEEGDWLITVDILTEKGAETVTFDTVFCEVTESGALLIFDANDRGDMLIRHGYADGAWIQFGVSGG